METLKNGAILVARSREHVLAFRTDGYHPWVTWRIDASGHTYWGHYFKNAFAAIDDFVARQQQEEKHD
jgi:hypothetical protein